MKGKRIPAALCAAVLCLALIFAALSSILPQKMRTTALAAESQTFDRQVVEKASVAFDAAAAILEKLQNIVTEELASDGSDTDEDFDTDEAEVFRNELGGDLAQIDMLLTSLNGLADDTESSEGKTVLAVREYLNMLRNISLDMRELLEYSVVLYEALVAMADFGEDYDGYSDFAYQLYYATGNAVDLMQEIVPPSYLKIAHDDLTIRIKEFQDFGEDFYVASELEDPLRFYSCMYRMNRIQVMLERCTDDLTNDVQLQFKQADKRLTGPIAVLHDELERNIRLLLAA